MTMINYWDCPFHDYDDWFDGEEEVRIYGCTHLKNTENYCEHDNKWCNEKADCKLLDMGEYDE